MSLAQLSKLLPLPNEELQQVIDYANTLSKADAVSHFSNLLGDSPQAIEFVSSFNSRRQDPSLVADPAVTSAEAPKNHAAIDNGSDAGPSGRSKRSGPKKKKAPLHTPEARRLENTFVPAGVAYNKKDQDLEYIPKTGGTSAPVSHQPSRSSTPKPATQAKPRTTSAGYLISESLAKPKIKSNPVSRSSTPKPASGSGSKTKVSLTGGTPMIGASAALADLDAAIRSLEISMDQYSDDVASRRCDCVATRHPLQSAAPNCLSCGKVICVKEGLGPCTHCGTPLLTEAEVASMVRELKDERGRERSAANAAAHRKAPVSKTPALFSRSRGGQNEDDGFHGASTLSEAEARAREHRDKLLNFQAQNAKRTTVRDEAADFDATRGGSMWSTPEERARELKRQQKLVRELEWNARPEYEKRKQVVSIDLVGGKVVRRMAAVERPPSPGDEGEPRGEDEADAGAVLGETTGNSQRVGRAGGAFSGNPLLGKMIKPVFRAEGKGKEKESEADIIPSRTERKKGWRRVQDDQDDNEGVILDGGVYGYEGHKGQSRAGG